MRTTAVILTISLTLGLALTPATAYPHHGRSHGGPARVGPGVGGSGTARPFGTRPFRTPPFVAHPFVHRRVVPFGVIASPVIVFAPPPVVYSAPPVFYYPPPTMGTVAVAPAPPPMPTVIQYPTGRARCFLGAPLCRGVAPLQPLPARAMKRDARTNALTALPGSVGRMRHYGRGSLPERWVFSGITWSTSCFPLDNVIRLDYGFPLSRVHPHRVLTGRPRRNGRWPQAAPGTPARRGGSHDRSPFVTTTVVLGPYGGIPLTPVPTTGWAPLPA